MMIMRSKPFLFCLPLLALSVPAAAQDIVFVAGTGDAAPISAFGGESAAQPDRDDDIADFAERVDDPAVQQGVSKAVERMAGAVMNMRVGPLAEAIERARPGTVDRRIRRDSTIGDLAGRNAAYLPAQLGEQSREMMGMLSGFARAMAAMMPEFKQMARELEASVKTAKAEAARKSY
jgi:hypothetical protein